MRLRFKVQRYQTDATDAVCDVFEGQPDKLRKSNKDRRQQLEDEGVRDKDKIIVRNKDFPSANEAACVVYGCNTNARKWERAEK